jgi:hypothetical protein
MNNNLVQLKDIKPIVDVVDYSFYYLLALIVFVSIVIIFALYKYFTRIKKTKQPSKRKIVLKRLKTLDFINTKEVVYSFSVDGYIFINEKNKQEFETIEKELETYKYKKDVKRLSNDLQDKIKKFIKALK